MYTVVEFFHVSTVVGLYGSDTSARTTRNRASRLHGTDLFFIRISIRGVREGHQAVSGVVMSVLHHGLLHHPPIRRLSLAVVSVVSRSKSLHKSTFQKMQQQSHSKTTVFSRAPGSDVTRMNEAGLNQSSLYARYSRWCRSEKPFRNPVSSINNRQMLRLD